MRLEFYIRRKLQVKLSKTPEENPSTLKASLNFIVKTMLMISFFRPLLLDKFDMRQFDFTCEKSGT